MSERIYIDTNIYMDYCDRRSDNIRPLYEIAYDIFRRTLECEFDIVVSDWIMKELGDNIKNSQSLNIILAELKQRNKLVYVESTYREKSNAHKFQNWKDALHAIVAKRAKCKYIVTRNMIDFLEFSDILEPKLPEHL